MHGPRHRSFHPTPGTDRRTVTSVRVPGGRVVGRRVRVLLSLGMALTLTAGACPQEHDPDTPTWTGPTPGLAPTTAESGPVSVTDCGTLSALSGWPTTTTSFPDRFACILGALAAGTPARMVVVSVGAGDSGRQTADGYDLPTRVVSTWVVTGPGQVDQTVDRTEDGGEVTAETCTGLAVTPDGTLTATGCTPT